MPEYTKLKQTTIAIALLFTTISHAGGREKGGGSLGNGGDGWVCFKTKSAAKRVRARRQKKLNPVPPSEIKNVVSVELMDLREAKRRKDWEGAPYQVIEANGMSWQEIYRQRMTLLEKFIPNAVKVNQDLDNMRFDAADYEGVKEVSDSSHLFAETAKCLIVQLAVHRHLGKNLVEIARNASLIDRLSPVGRAAFEAHERLYAYRTSEHHFILTGSVTDSVEIRRLVGGIFTKNILDRYPETHDQGEEISSLYSAALNTKTEYTIRRSFRGHTIILAERPTLDKDGILVQPAFTGTPIPTDATPPHFMSNKSDGIEIKGKFRYDLNTERFLAAHPAREQGLYFWQRYLRHVLITPETNMTFHSNGQIKSIDRIANGYVETQGVQVNFPRKSEDRSYGDTSYLELDEEGRLKRLIPSSQSKVILTDQAVKTAFAEPYGERIRFKKFIDIDSISLELIEYYPVSEIIEEIKFYNDGSIHSLSTNKRALSSISQREGVITFTAKKPSANSLDDWTVSFMEEK